MDYPSSSSDEEPKAAVAMQPDSRRFRGQLPETPKMPVILRALSAVKEPKNPLLLFVMLYLRRSPIRSQQRKLPCTHRPIACTLPLYPRTGDSPLLLRRSLRLVFCLSIVVLACISAQAGPLIAAPTLPIHDLGNGSVPLDGPWQFHLGDDSTFAAPGTDDATGHNGWERLTTDAPWGAQGHRAYVGFAWYRMHISI